MNVKSLRTVWYIPSTSLYHCLLRFLYQQVKSLKNSSKYQTFHCCREHNILRTFWKITDILIRSEQRNLYYSYDRNKCLIWRNLINDSRPRSAMVAEKQNNQTKNHSMSTIWYKNEGKNEFFVVLWGWGVIVWVKLKYSELDLKLHNHDTSNSQLRRYLGCVVQNPFFSMIHAICIKFHSKVNKDLKKRSSYHDNLKCRGGEIYFQTRIVSKD